ncbi:MAG: HAD-IA family hydrolase [Myxococcota bacterium]
MHIVFDWDGTLADSKQKIVGCLRRAFEQLGAQPLSDERLASIIGLGLPESARALYPGADDAFVDGFVQRYRDLWLAPNADHASLFPGTRDVLETLRDRGLTLTVATGKSRRGLERELRETGLGSCFLATRCADETASKPDPKMLLELFDVTGTTPADTIMVGDSEWDLRMAADAGVRTVAVSYGAQPIVHLRSFGPTACIDAITELPAVLARLNL